MKAKGLILTHSGQEPYESAIDRKRTPHLIPIGNKPILFHVLESMAAAGISDVAIAVTADAEDMIGEAVGSGASWGMQISCLRTDRSDCVPAVLLEGEAFIDGHPFVFQHGDGLLRHDLGALLPAVEDEEEGLDAVLLVHPAARSDNGGPRRDCGAPLRPVSDDLPPRPGLAVAGAQIFGQGFIRRAGDLLRRNQSDADIPALAARLARASIRVSVRRVGGWRRFDGDPHALLEMNRLLLDELDTHSSEPDASELELEGTRIEGRVMIDPSARIRSSVIRGPVVIGANAIIADAFVGPYTAIGDGARIEGVEIENSIVSTDATILHVGARMESCVIGRGARVARHFSVPHAMRLQLGDSSSVLLG